MYGPERPLKIRTHINAFLIKNIQALILQGFRFRFNISFVPANICEGPKDLRPWAQEAPSPFKFVLI